MIIRFPTGLYEDVGDIPTKLTQSGNITFTISSQDPSRSTDTFLQLPAIEERRKRDELVFTETQRRIDQGDLVFTLVAGNAVDSGSNIKLFEIGQFLEFGENIDESLEDVAITNAPDIIDIMHFTNLLDLQEAGLSQDEIDQVLEQAFVRQKELEQQIAELQVEIKDLESSIIEKQKFINETNKILSALNEIGTSDTELLNKLEERLDTLLSERDNLISDVNTKKETLNSAYNSLLRVSELVR